MKVFVNIKKAGSRRALVKTEYDIPFASGTVKDIFAFFVEKEVEKYNSRNDSAALMYLTEKDIDAAAQEGKVSFGYAQSERNADLQKAVDNALLCFEDGLVRVLLNEDELEGLETPVNINENDLFTFIRLSFLTGRSW